VNAWRARRNDAFLWALFHKARVVNAWRARRNDGFLWAPFHKAIVVNAWRTRAYKAVDATCLVCDLEALETFMCRFYECLKAQLTQLWYLAHIQGNMKRLDILQCIFKSKKKKKKLPKAYKIFTPIWTLLTGAMVWSIWIEQNQRGLQKSGLL
jgi:hypothetical protein